MIHFALPWILLALIPGVGLLLWRARGLRRLSLVLRIAGLALALLALSQPRISERDPSNNVLFLVDRSASVTRTTDDRDLQRWIDRLMAGEPDWSYGLITFATRANLDVPLGSGSVELSRRVEDADASELVPAAELGLAALPTGGANQLVLLSDGRFSDDSDAAVALASLVGVPISVVPVGRSLLSDARLLQIDAPSDVPVGQSIEFSVEVMATTAGPATLALYQDDSLVEARDVDLPSGISTYAFSQLPSGAGLFEYKAIVKREGDDMPENDARSTMVRTTDRPSVLIVGSETSSVQKLVGAENLQYDLSTSVPSLAGLSDYRHVILTGRALDDLTPQEVTSLTQYVRNLGGGLLLIQGGEQVRGFTEGEIEDLLPVSYVVPEVEREASLAVVYLLDRSSSMAEIAGSMKKIRILRQAAAASILLLPPETLVGIIGFYDSYDWIFPLQRLGDATAAYRAIASLDAFGGTDVYYALDDAVDQLIAADARVKHIVLVSDGQTTEVGRDYPQLLAKLDEHPEITLSAIAISRTPNIPFLEKLVQHGRGGLYYATDFTTLPQITMQVTQHLSRSRVITGRTPVEAASGFLTTADSIPPIDEYVLTYPRATSTTLLSAGDDPLFSTWRTGLGSVSVLNTDLSSTSAGDWLRWSGMTTLFDAMLKTTEPLVTSAAGFAPSVSVEGTTSVLSVDAESGDGQFENFLTFSATLLPDGESLNLHQVAAGLYQAAFRTPAEGGHAILAQELDDGRSFAYPFAVPYSDEFGALGPDQAALRAIATTTGGRVLDSDSGLVSASTPQSRQEINLFPVFLAAALGVFLIDLVLRRWNRPPRIRVLD